MNEWLDKRLAGVYTDTHISPRRYGLCYIDRLVSIKRRRNVNIDRILLRKETQQKSEDKKFTIKTNWIFGIFVIVFS